jgi:hypothetical protein
MRSSRRSNASASARRFSSPGLVTRPGDCSLSTLARYSSMALRSVMLATSVRFSSGAPVSGDVRWFLRNHSSIAYRS